MPLVIIEEVLQAVLLAGFQRIVTEINTPPADPPDPLRVDVFDSVFSLMDATKRGQLRTWLGAHPPTLTNPSTGRINLHIEYPREDMVLPAIAITVAPSSDSGQYVGDFALQVPLGPVEVDGHFEIHSAWHAQETALITILSENRNIILALHQCIRAILWLAKETLSETYGIDQMVLSAQDVKPMSATKDDLPIFARSLNLRCVAYNELSERVGRIKEIDLTVENFENELTIFTD